LGKKKSRKEEKLAGGQGKQTPPSPPSLSQGLDPSLDWMFSTDKQAFETPAGL